MGRTLRVLKPSARSRFACVRRAWGGNQRVDAALFPRWNRFPAFRRATRREWPVRIVGDVRVDFFCRSAWTPVFFIQR